MIEWPVLMLGLWKTIVLIYDVITFPFYFFKQKPWEVLKRANAVRARLERFDDPYSSWVRVGSPANPIASKVMEGTDNLGELLHKCFELYGQKRCYGYREVFGEEEEKQPNGKVFRKLILSDEYTWYTYYEANHRIEDIAQGFLANGIKAGDKVIVFAETRLEWMLSAQALFRVGATLATLYATLGDDAVCHGINESEASHVITSSDLLAKLAKLQPKMPYVTCVIYMEDPLHKKAKIDPSAKDRFTVLAFSDVESQGQTMTKSGNRINTTPSKPDDIAVLMYTSGSTGTPKAVMISHKNFMCGVESVLNTILAEMEMDDEVFLGYLPLAHIFELVSELSLLMMGIPTAYSTVQTMTDASTAVKRGCKGDVSVVRPTIMPCVPLILDRIRKNVTEKVQRNNRILRGIFEFALDYKTFWKRKGFSTPLVEKFVFYSIKKIMGGRMKLIMVGGAPLSPETQEFSSNCLDCKVIQGYAATEVSAAATVMDVHDLSFGRVGAPLYGVKLRLKDWREGGYYATDRPHPRGEIVIGGSHITQGYFKNEGQTSEVYKDEDGTRWWYTGDIGEIYPDGTVKIVDRKKDLVKLQHGEYISLGKVEAALSFCDYVDNLCVYGDSFHLNLIALIVPNRPALLKLAESLGKDKSLPFSQLCQDRDIVTSVKKAIVEHSTRSGLLRTEIPSEIKLCAEDWVPDSGLVTAALKIRRKQIQDFYQKDILAMYGSPSSKST